MQESFLRDVESFMERRYEGITHTGVMLEGRLTTAF